MDEVDSPVINDRPKRVSKKRLEELQDVKDPKFVAVYYRPGPGKALMPLMSRLRRDAATVFSDVMERELGEDGKFVAFETANPEPYKQLLNWMSECVIAGNDIPFPEPPIADPFEPILAVMVAASKLHVPEGSLNVFLKKRLHKIAREHVMSLEMVRKIYDPADSEFGGNLGMDLREIATTSIFEGWWTKKLEEDRFTDYMCDLADLRDEVAQLDEDLHNAVVKKREFFKQLREKRRAERLAEQANTTAVESNDFGGSGASWAANSDNVMSGGGTEWQGADGGTDSFEYPSMTTDQVSMDWDSGAPTPSWMAQDGTPENANSSEAINDRIEKSVNWADEMNEEPCIWG